MADDDAVYELPIPVTTPTPPKEMVRLLGEGERPCGTGRFRVIWDTGQWRGQRLDMYCNLPRCLPQFGGDFTCTGPHFVPGLGQGRREVSPQEAVAASRAASELARRQTGRPDTRSDEEVWQDIKVSRERALVAYKGKGEWG